MSDWRVVVSRKVENKAVPALPSAVQLQLLSLIKDIELNGPVRGNWPNYSPLGGGRHHCHIKKGRPTYVACWAVQDKTIRLVEVYYAGTHEKAPY